MLDCMLPIKFVSDALLFAGKDDAASLSNFKPSAISAINITAPTGPANLPITRIDVLAVTLATLLAVLAVLPTTLAVLLAVSPTTLAVFLTTFEVDFAASMIVVLADLTTFLMREACDGLAAFLDCLIRA